MKQKSYQCTQLRCCYRQAWRGAGCRALRRLKAVEEAKEEFHIGAVQEEGSPRRGELDGGHVIASTTTAAAVTAASDRGADKIVCETGKHQAETLLDNLELQ